MPKANDQMPDLGKSINVFNNDPNVKNPFLRGGGPKQQQPIEAPARSNQSSEQSTDNPRPGT